MSDSQPFKDLKMVASQIEQFVQDLAKEYGVDGLGSAQCMALNYLHQHPDDEVFIKDIEKALKLSKSVASNLIKRMEKNALVVLIPSEKDKRYKQVRLTEEGLVASCRLPEFLSRLENDIFYGVDKEEFEITQKVISQIQNNINQRRKDV